MVPVSGSEQKQKQAAAHKAAKHARAPGLRALMHAAAPVLQELLLSTLLWRSSGSGGGGSGSSSGGGSKLKAPTGKQKQAGRSSCI